MKFYEKYGKRWLDIIISVFGLIIFSPIFFIVAVLIKLEGSGSVFFCQQRMGKGSRVFKLLKFRTMLPDKRIDRLQFTPGDIKRVTKVGKILRSTKIDELPVFINVLKGEMSIVGPRPEVPKYLNFYTGENEKIFSVKPGITDLASIKYRNEEELLGNSKTPEKFYQEKILPDKLKLNLSYLKSISLVSDLVIILNTLKVIFFKK